MKTAKGKSAESTAEQEVDCKDPDGSGERQRHDGDWVVKQKHGVTLQTTRSCVSSPGACHASVRRAMTLRGNADATRRSR